MLINEPSGDSVTIKGVRNTICNNTFGKEDLVNR